MVADAVNLYVKALSRCLKETKQMCIKGRDIAQFVYGVSDEGG